MTRPLSALDHAPCGPIGCNTVLSHRMTITYDPEHPKYLDEADVRGELTRVFDLCHGCRQCIELCTSFPTLFEMIDRHDDHDAGRLTPAQQDQVVDECFQCKLLLRQLPVHAPDSARVGASTSRG